MPQRLIIDVAGTELSEQDRQLLMHPEIAGIILFSRNYQNRKQLVDLVAAIRESSPGLLICVDQEGGRVQRFKEDFEKLPSLQKITRASRDTGTDTQDISYCLGWLMAAEILAAGIDISFAPVLDLDDEHCEVIADRSFSPDPDEAITLARAYLAGMREAGMKGTAKHFPGHGSVREDSHLTLPRDMRSLEEVRQLDLKPFVALAGEYNAVMPGHILFPEIDSQPVGFSPFWLQEILRKELDFRGAIFSDDLTMEGAAESGGYQERSRLALEAGCDLLLVCNNRAGALEVLNFLENQPGDSTVAKELMKPTKFWNQESLVKDDCYSRAKNYLQIIEGMS